MLQTRRQVARTARTGWARLVSGCKLISMQPYERIAKVIRYMDANHREQPDLATLAREAGLNPHHFHRVFSEWAGVTPKDFLQCITLAHVRPALRAGESVLGAALDAGLSGPGRLHDLCVTLDAATPGEWKNGGAGWTLRHGWTASPFGPMHIAEGPRGIAHLSFWDEEDATAALGELRGEWPGAELIRDDATAARLGATIFEHPPGEPRAPLRAWVRGTPFQVRVWRALLGVQPGHTTSYGRLAAEAGAPAACRAVGTAVGRNAISFLVPCHRVIRETGVTGQYRWGPGRKRAMLMWEGARQAR